MICRSILRRTVVPLLPVLLASACTDAPDTSAMVRDSAGIRIVEASAGGAPTRKVTDPLVAIGVTDGAAPYQFHGIRHVALTRDSGVVVLDGGSRQIRRFDKSGAHLWTAGGPGEGPGEFQQPVFLGTSRDGSHAIWDRRLARLTYVDDSGSISRTESYAGAEGTAPIAHRMFADGSLLITLPAIASPPPAGSFMSDTLRYARLTAPGAQPIPLGAAPGATWLWTGRSMVPVPFTAPPQHAVLNDVLVIASGPAPELRVIDATGVATALYRAAWSSVPVTDEDVQTVVSDWTEREYYGATAQDWARWRSEMPIPDLRPAYDRLIVTSDGEIWARRYEAISLPVPNATWDVFGRNGAASAVVETPAGFEPTSVMGALVAGIWFDENEVQHVHVYRIAVTDATANS